MKYKTNSLLIRLKFNAHCALLFYSSSFFEALILFVILEKWRGHVFISISLALHLATSSSNSPSDYSTG